MLNNLAKNLFLFRRVGDFLIQFFIGRQKAHSFASFGLRELQMCVLVWWLYTSSS
jgi:hypothetical protein